MDYNNWLCITAIAYLSRVTLVRDLGQASSLTLASKLHLKVLAWDGGWVKNKFEKYIIEAYNANAS